MKNFFKNPTGLTLLEILLVIGILVVLIGGIIAAINPFRHFAQTNNNARWQGIMAIRDAILQNITDNRGYFICEAGPIPTATTTIGSGLDQYNICPCLVPRYLSKMPVDPQYGYYEDCTDYNTEYTIRGPGVIIEAPHAQLGEEIFVSLPWEIAAEGWFSLSANPSSGSISAGETTTTTVTASASLAFSSSNFVFSKENQNHPSEDKRLLSSKISKIQLSFLTIDNPRIISASVKPEKVRPGDKMVVEAEIKDDYGIKEVLADMGGIETIELELKEGTEKKGIWQAEWLVHSVEPGEYKTIIIAKNILGLSSKTEITWTDDPGWLTGWGYRKSHVINAASGAGTNYQIKIVAHYGSGTDSGENVYLNGKSRTDFGDIRFTDDDGTTILDHWIEKKVDSDYAIFWVEVLDDLSTNAQTIYIYYGNPSATYPFLASESAHGEATFIFFDDFEDGDIAGWVTYGSGVCQYATDATQGGVIKKTSYNDPNGCYRAIGQTLSSFRAVFLTNRINNLGGALDRYSLGGTTDCQGYGPRKQTNGTSDDFYIEERSSGCTASVIGSTYHISYQDTWYKQVFTYYNQNMTYTLYDMAGNQIQTVSASDPTYSSFSYFFIHGGWEYLTDEIRIMKYVDPEPSHGAWGSEETPINPPTVSTLPATDITASEATLNGEITDTGGEAATECGFDWDTDSGEPYANYTVATCPAATGTFSATITGLNPGTTYYFRAKAQNSAGWGYGSELSFTTLAPDFSISADPNYIKAPQTGTSQVSIITIQSINGFNSAVDLSVSSGLPSGATANFDPNPVTPPPDGIATSTFVVNTSNVSAGIYTLTVQGQSDSLIHATSVDLEVVDLYVNLTANPSTGTAPLLDVDLTADVSGSATGTINYQFDCTDDGTFEFTITTTTDPYTAIDICDYQNPGNFVARVRVERDVANPAEATTTITVEAPPVTFSATVSPQEPTISLSFDPLSCTPTCSSILTITTDPTTPPGTYTITITATDPSGFSQETEYILTVY